ncbi:MAG: hypothetical protein H6647_09010 [Anaerolineales bacterium]|nr:hypothetical protein [Anaerolineales bacterium]
MAGDLVTSVKSGWMWFDNDPKTSLEDKLQQASERYRQKFGQKPRLCYVNGSTLVESQPAVGALQIAARAMCCRATSCSWSMATMLIDNQRNLCCGQADGMTPICQCTSILICGIRMLTSDQTPAPAVHAQVSGDANFSNKG